MIKTNVIHCDRALPQKKISPAIWVDVGVEDATNAIFTLHRLLQ